MIASALRPARRPALRPARLSDASKLTALEGRAFSGYYASHRFTLAQFRYYLARSCTIARVARVHSSIVGYSLGIQQTGRRRHVARLLSLAVDPRARTRGLGTRLLEVFLEEAHRRGCRSVYLEVAARNVPAIRLFARCGFTRVRSLPGYYAPSVSGLRMRLALTR